MLEVAVHAVVVDNDDVFRDLIATLLRREGYTVTAVGRAHEALHLAEGGGAGLVVLDTDIPEMSGWELVTRIRATSTVPIVIVSDRDAETDHVLGLDLGADDYVLKPFRAREFAARVRAVLRRAQVTATAQPAALVFGDLEIRVATREAHVRGRAIPLTPREFDVLAYFAAHPRRAIARTELLREVWKSSEEWQDVATVTEHVRRMRHKIERGGGSGEWVRVVRNVGYCFEPD